ncbi:MAG: hypothetical protein GF330_03405 [Candidatus Eisenbacteria bacterium]|nr:hypothetical protein [Candidatus Eisenbacteria bacterium]
MKMRVMLGGGLLAAAVLACPVRSEVPEAFPLSEVRPGLRGTVWTVFSGFEPDSFTIEVLDRVPGSRAGGDIILVRALDDRLQRTGIAQGMSGSPVLCEGRLLGALAFAFPFSTEPIAGVTPFSEMRAALDPAFTEITAGRRDAGAESGPLWPEGRPPDYGTWRALCADPARLAQRWPGIGALGEVGPAGMTRLLLPLVCEAQALEAARGWMPLWRRYGLLPVAGAVGAGTAAEGPAHALRPGDALSVDLVSGDMRASAIGTVTWVDGDRIWAFGHPFLFGGRTELPVSRARIHALVPNRAVSFKMGSGSEPVGMLVADRRSGVAAVRGGRARTVPLQLRVRGPQEGSFTDYEFDLAYHALLTPGLAALASASALSAHRFELRVATMASDLTLTLEGGRRLQREDLFRSLSVAQTVGAAVLAPVSYLAISPYADFPLRRIELEVVLDPELRAANIDRLRLTKKAVRPGDSLAVEIRLQEHLGGTTSERVVLRVPDWVRGEALLVMAGSVAAFTEWDQERAPEKYNARNQADLLRLIETFPSDETLIVRLYGASRGAILRGQEISSVPVSKWRALSRSVTGGDVSTVVGNSLDQREIPTGRVILGGTAVEVAIAR